MKLPFNWDKLLKSLRILPEVGGLEISDAFLRYAYLDGETWHTAALRLTPGLVEGGHVNDHAKFVEVLRTLHEQIAGPRSRHKINVVVSLSSVNVYSQVFTLPVIEGENLDKAIQLNIQMVSPGEQAQTYSGWQMLGQDKQSVRLEILSSFVNRVVVDDITKALQESGFVVHSVESRALSLTRILRMLGAGFDATQSYIVLSLDSSGLEFLVLRRGQLYFQYFNSWKDLYGGERQITEAAFEAAVIRNLHQVLNFYNSHWTEPLAGIYMATTAFEEKIRSIVQTNFQLTILDPQLRMGGAVSADWFVALGSGLRGNVTRKDDQEISLLGISAQDEYRRTQAVAFLRFWRVLIPATLGILLLFFLASDIILRNTEDSLDEQATFQTGGATTEVTLLQQKVQEFNRTASAISSALRMTKPKFDLFEGVHRTAAAHNVTLLRFEFQDITSPVVLEGRAKTDEAVRNFYLALQSDKAKYEKASLQPSDIKFNGDEVSFRMTLTFVNTP
jgi:hypothetical protein